MSIWFQIISYNVEYNKFLLYLSICVSVAAVPLCLCGVYLGVSRECPSTSEEKQQNIAKPSNYECGWKEKTEG